MVKGRSTYRRLNAYIGREYVFSFIVSFAFFFFIFFVNQILVLFKHITLKNVSIPDVLYLVILSIPQFLMFTMPFSSLASASMVIGNLGSQNEILALRASGINIRRIFRPILILSFVLSLTTLWIADSLIPFTATQYKSLYSKLLTSVPTLQLKPYSSTQFPNMVITNGDIADNRVEDIVIFDNSVSSRSKVISADSATITLVDEDTLTYEIDLSKPQLMITNSHDNEDYQVSHANGMKLYLELAPKGSSTSSLSASQMSVRALYSAIRHRLESNTQTDSYYLRSYRSELGKKTALSFACTALVFIAFPISFYKVRNGRLVGFGLSMIVAVIYWFFLYFMHLTSFESSFSPYLLMWLPNITVFVIGLVLVLRQRRRM